MKQTTNLHFAWNHFQHHENAQTKDGECAWWLTKNLQIRCPCYLDDIYKLRSCIKCFISVLFFLWNQQTFFSFSHLLEWQQNENENGVNESFSMLLKLITTDINRMIYSVNCCIVFFYCERAFGRFMLQAMARLNWC